MRIIETGIEDLVVIEPKLFRDSRGYFMESFSDSLFRAKVFNTHFVQDNESKSSYGVVRGLHYQLAPFAQSKLIRVPVGRVLDVAVDLRKDSPTYGKHFSVELSSDNFLMLFIPRGFAHGFSVLSQECLFQYKCDNYYSPNHEASIIWNDPHLNIDWGIPVQDVILSPKDQAHPLFSDAPHFEHGKELYL